MCDGTGGARCIFIYQRTVTALARVAGGRLSEWTSRCGLCRVLEVRYCVLSDVDGGCCGGEITVQVGNTWESSRMRYG